MSSDNPPDQTTKSFGRLPEAVRQDIESFQRTRDWNVLDRIIDGAIAAQLAPTKAGPAAPLAEDAPLLDGTGLTSLDVIELVFLLEDALNIQISNEEITNVRTLRELRSFIRQKLEAPPGASA